MIMYLYNYLYNNTIAYKKVDPHMATITISIPKNLKKQMEKYPEINWPELIKNRLKGRAEDLFTYEKQRTKKET